MVHEQKFKDLLSSTCQVSVERIVLDLGGYERPGSYSHCGSHFVTGFFCFHAVKTKIPILAFLPICEKPICRASIHVLEDQSSGQRKTVDCIKIDDRRIPKVRIQL